ncbi:MAG TPA: histidinol-phosphatase HisJ family protein [Bacillota bacterium]|nr:histidinol-phosphatase HisJ family protein [Bacillota bacterium]HOB86745.1 histidinol-phosphatase HisJ family protein [Bacillota bacterium]HOP69825.1 histidinol-phosphatase HisJ family protein [Bacillota bacterium]HPT34822.1 histidinol-phosphatase HisJ family protein [Bacillota bacterium]HPZ64185.1 histidinol-phosphatase HisJ family protein [Bacillota bacterium]
MVDYHLHTPLCRHALGSLEEYLAAAEQKGLKEIGIADHFPLELLGFAPEAQVTMEAEELPGYVESVLRLSSRSGPTGVKLGIEADYIPGTEERLERELSRYPWDYVIGSVHFMDGWDFSHPFFVQEYEKRDLVAVYDRYFQLVREACRTGLFDTIGHPDVIKKFGYRPEVDLEPYWVEIASVLKETGTCFELNTSGLDTPAEEFYPGRPFLEILCRAGVGVTLGSDAHEPESVGRHFDRALALLRQVGFKELAVFSRRQRLSLPL